jgi:3-hydroxyacyl-[acyl-carrier-protein] dehydratase
MSAQHNLKNFLTLPVVEVYDKARIKNTIPHREPFLFVDEVRVLEQDKKYLGVYRVRQDEYFFKGHFPHYPVMPGVLVVESMSQAFGGALLNRVSRFGDIPLFLSIDEAKFRGQVCPGDELLMPIEVLRLGKISRIYGEAYVNGKLCVQAALNFILGDSHHV